MEVEKGLARPEFVLTWTYMDQVSAEGSWAQSLPPCFPKWRSADAKDAGCLMRWVTVPTSLAF